MTRDDAPFTPGEVDEQIELFAHLRAFAPSAGRQPPNERLVDDLRALYPADPEVARALERVRQRLAQQSAAAPQPQPRERQRLRERGAQRERPARMPPAVRLLHSAWRPPARLANVAAAIILVALLGGLTAGLILVHHRGAIVSGPTCHSDPVPANSTQWNLYVESGGGPYKLAAKDGRLLWSYSVSSATASTSSQVDDESAPLVADGSVYFLVAGFVDEPDGIHVDTTQTVYALNASTGALRWRTPLGKGGTGFVVGVTCGLVYVRDDVGNNTNVLYALDARTGKLRWRSASTAPRYMVAANGMVYAASYSFPAHNSSLSALNGTDGALLWERVLPGGAGFFPGGEQSFSSFFPQVKGGVVYAVASVDAATVRVYAYGARDGKLLWRSGTIKNLGAFSSPPAIGNGAIYFGTDRGVVSAFSTPDGAPLWQYNVGHPVYASPQVAGDMVYLSAAGPGDANSDHLVLALDARQGTLRWQQVLHRDIGYSGFQFALNAGALYFSGYADTSVTALNATNGALLWSCTYRSAGPGSVGGLITVAP